MLFNSYVFILGFLPLALIGFFGAARFFGPKTALAWLVGSSLLFYGWWNPKYLGLIGLSTTVNFFFGRTLGRLTDEAMTGRRRWVLAAGVSFNLGLLGYYKYANFFVESLNALAGTQFNLERIFLPLAISFFTFQQIAFIVDASRGKTGPYSFLEYCFLVTFFPHLIAGPIVQHGDLLSQVRPEAFRPSSRNLAIGTMMFVSGLFKKVVVADRLAPMVWPVYDGGAADFTTVGAWVATVAYSFQLYFDFSGYSDMAIGLARMFNFTFPLNFDSPYKANSIVEFWRRWHLSLSRFLREYLYFSLGGNRQGRFRRHLNLILTMVLGGFWHGAGLGFILWGALNGLYLVATHLWNEWRGVDPESPPQRGGFRLELAGLGTFVLVMLSRVFFRAPDLHQALDILSALAFRSASGLGSLMDQLPTVLLFVLLWVHCRTMPHTQEVLADHAPVTRPLQGVPWLRFRFSTRWAAALATMAALSFLSMQQVSEFLYFQF